MSIKAKTAGILAVFLAIGGMLRAQNVDQPPVHVNRFLAPASAQELAPVGKYVGPGSCSAVACHGAITPQVKTKVLQNEYSTWVTQDKHARAYSALDGSLSRQMTSILKIGPANKSKRCLVCHALSIEPAHRAREFDVAEGVSCESCHGPASAWLGPHIQPTANHADMVRLGLVDNKSLGVRSESCLSCHLGAKGMEVDHEMIAAGHPDLTFELDSFTAVEPPHWVEKNADPLFGMRAWGVGQAVQMREGMFRIARRAHTGPWPEFSEMDCITCHHALTGPESWRQKEGYVDRQAGDPPYNLARFVVFRHFAREIDPAATQEMEAATAQVAHLVTTMSTDRGAVESAATRAAELSDKLVAEVSAARYDRDRTERLLRNIASDGDMISRQGERAAEQATMSVDSLYIAIAKAGRTNPETRSAIDALFMQVKNPSTYNAPQFAAQMRSVAATLR
jgi:Cytochrome c554 and c-prime